MAMIYVKTKEGRAAFYAGRVIPHDHFIPVTNDPYIRRLVEHWEDIEVQSDSPPPEGGEGEGGAKAKPAATS